MNGNEVPLENAQKLAKTAFKALMPFQLMHSTTPEKQLALDRLNDKSRSLEEEFNIICPDWENMVI